MIFYMVVIKMIYLEEKGNDTLYGKGGNDKYGNEGKDMLW